MPFISAVKPDLYSVSFLPEVFKFFTKILILLCIPFFEIKSKPRKSNSLIILDLKLFVSFKTLSPVEEKLRYPYSSPSLKSPDKL